MTISGYGSEIPVIANNSYAWNVTINGDSVTVSNLELTNPKGRAVLVNTGASYAKVLNSTMHDFSYTAVNVNGDHALFEGNSISKANLDNDCPN